jgi:hypothetical protein
MIDSNEMVLNQKIGNAKSDSIKASHVLTEVRELTVTNKLLAGVRKNLERRQIKIYLHMHTIK